MVGLDLLHSRLSSIEDSEELLELTEDSKVSAETAVSILNDLLNYEKLDSNLLTLDVSEIRLVPFLREQLRPFQLHASQKSIQLSIIPSTYVSSINLDHLMVTVDIPKIAQVLRNFVSNAIKFTPSGGSVEVSLELIKNSNSNRSRLRSLNLLGSRGSIVYPLDNDGISAYGSVRVAVKDSGHGIAPENQHRVFNEIVQFNANAHQGGGGSGLGLWISKQIVELHGGRVGLHSEGEGYGCEFFFQLPILKWDSNYIRQKSLKAPSHLSAPDASAGEPPLHVLIVDDSGLNRKVMGKLITSLGHTFEEADDGDVAVEMVKGSVEGGTGYDVILMDSVMPKMTGTEAIRCLRSFNYTGMIIGVTGNAAAEDIEEFKSSGADRVLVKPVHVNVIDDLFNRIPRRR